MTAESLADLNVLTLIGCTDERGSAWHRRDDLQGAEDNHYAGFIPISDVTRRLFDWQPRQAEVAYLVPSGLGVGDPAIAERDDLVTMDGAVFRVVRTQQSRVGVLRNDNDYDMGVFKAGVNHPPYTETLIRSAEKLTGEVLGVSSAGLLSKGGRAWVEFSLPETLHDELSGFDYRPNLLKADSMDGTIANTTAMTINATVCDNTLSANLFEAGSAGRIFKRKHTSLFASSLADERAALGLLEKVTDEFTAELHQLIKQELTPQQRIEVMDILVPLPEDEGRGMTLAQNKRDRLVALESSPMVAPWIGTAFGELQRFNTDDHWQAPVKGTGRWERNTWRAINGKRHQADREVIKALELVLA